MKIMRKKDFIQSIADAFQFISCYHSLDFIQAMHQAYTKEQSPRAKNAITQILLNSRMAAEGRRPICQDTGVAIVFLRIGMDVRWDLTDQTINEMVNEGVQLAYTNPINPLRASVVNNPSGKRENTGDNTPAVVGPVPSAPGEIIGPAGPTTATRMDKFTELMLSKTHMLGMIGKGERGPVAIDAIKRHQSISLIAVGGAAYLVSKCIRKSRIIAFEELGMEAIRELEVIDMPVTVAVTADGQSIHEIGPKEWRIKISEIKRQGND